MAVESVKDVFESLIPGRLEKKPELAGQINAKYKFAVAGDDGGTWVVDLTTEGGSVTAGDGEADCTIDIEAEDLMVVRQCIDQSVPFVSARAETHDQDDPRPA